MNFANVSLCAIVEPIDSTHTSLPMVWSMTVCSTIFFFKKKVSIKKMEAEVRRLQCAFVYFVFNMCVRFAVLIFEQREKMELVATIQQMRNSNKLSLSDLYEIVHISTTLEWAILLVYFIIYQYFVILTSTPCYSLVPTATRQYIVLTKWVNQYYNFFTIKFYFGISLETV